MFKKILTLVLLVFAVGFTKAQTIIPRAAFALSSTNASPAEDEYGMKTELSSGTGFALGAGYNYALGNIGKGSLSVQPELYFIQKGFQADISGEVYDGEAIYDFTAEQKLKINYFEIPLLAKIEFGSPTAKFAFLAGPSLGFGIGGKVKGTVTYDDGYSTTQKDIKGDIKFGDAPANQEEEENFDYYFDNRMDFGIQLGAGVTLYEKVIIEFRYGLGLTDLSDDADSANRTLQFSVGVPIRIK